tara:strand:- start:292 stop:699 length:408 start_codon:yes stop_codon:yes gene_type:complete
MKNFKLSSVVIGALAGCLLLSLFSFSQPRQKIQWEYRENEKIVVTKVPASRFFTASSMGVALFKTKEGVWTFGGVAVGFKPLSEEEQLDPLFFHKKWEEYLAMDGLAGWEVFQVDSKEGRANRSEKKYHMRRRLN